MADISKETGTIAVLAKRKVEERLPKALAIKARVDKGEVLNDLDLAFLEEVIAGARQNWSLLKDPRVLEIAGRILELYGELTEKALENEKAGK